jgi:hypothetical protein
MKSLKTRNGPKGNSKAWKRKFLFSRVRGRARLLYLSCFSHLMIRQIFFDVHYSSYWLVNEGRLWKRWS